MNPALSDNTRCSGSDDRPGVGTPVLSTRSITTAREASTRADLEALFGHSLVALAVDLDLGRTLDLPRLIGTPPPSIASRAARYRRVWLVGAAIPRRAIYNPPTSLSEFFERKTGEAT